MGGISNMEDAKSDAMIRALNRLVAYQQDTRYHNYSENERVLDVIKRATTILEAAECDPFGSWGRDRRRYSVRGCKN